MALVLRQLVKYEEGESEVQFYSRLSVITQSMLKDNQTVRLLACGNQGMVIEIHDSAPDTLDLQDVVQDILDEWESAYPKPMSKNVFIADKLREWLLRRECK